MNFGRSFFDLWRDEKGEFDADKCKILLDSSGIFHIVELEDGNSTFDVAKNNLSSIQEFIEFFKMLLFFFNNHNSEMIEKFFSKLDYLGFSANGRLEMNSEDGNDILNSMIQAAYLMHEKDNEMNKMIYEHFYEKVKGLVKGE